MEKKQSINTCSFQSRMRIHKPTSRSKSTTEYKPRIKNLPTKNRFQFRHLSNIAELTEENQPQGKTVIEQNINNCQGKWLTQEDVGENRDKKQEENCFKRTAKNCFKKGINCLSFMYTKITQKLFSQQINIQQSQISQVLQKLRKKKSRRLNLLPQLPSSPSKIRTLVLDLDQTLIYSTFKLTDKYDFQIQVQVNGEKIPLFVIKRFGVDSFIFQMSQLYQLVIFSSAKDDYIEKIMEKLDPKKKIKYLLSREHCIVINKCYYIKSVRDLGRDPQNVIVVDSHQISASLNPENLYKIDCFKGSSKDRKLIKLGYFLKHLESSKQITQIIPIQMLRRQFQSKQIRISQKSNKQNRKKENPSRKKSKHQVVFPRFQEQESSAGFFQKN